MNTDDDCLVLQPVKVPTVTPADSLPGRPMRVRCATCKDPFQVTVHDFLDVTGNDQLKAWIVSGRLFEKRCPKCGSTGPILYPFTYVDKNSSLLVKVCESREKALEVEDTNSTVDMGGWDEPWRAEGGHNVRVAVGGIEALSEMIRIVDAGLDPYAVMLGKRMLLTSSAGHAGLELTFDSVDAADGGALKFRTRDTTTGKIDGMSLFRSAYDRIVSELQSHDYEPLRFAEVVDVKSIDKLMLRCASCDVAPSADFLRRKAAAKGRNGDAWFELGVAYYYGDGIRQNNFKAFKCFREGAEAGNAEAQNALAMCYVHGLGVNQSPMRAGAWYSAAAKQGNVDGMYGMGLIAHFGTALHSVNYEEAKGWYEKAIAGGHARANFSLGNLYEEGLGVKKDLAKASNLYKVAKDMGVEDAAAAYDRVRRMYTKESILSDKRTMKIAKETGADPVVVQNELAISDALMDVLSAGSGGATTDTLKSIQEAAERGNANAQYLLGLTYEKGEVIARDYKKAWEWYDKAKDQDQVKAVLAVGRFIELGLDSGTPDVETACTYYEYAWKNLKSEDGKRLYESAKRKLEACKQTDSAVSKSSEIKTVEDFDKAWWISKIKHLAEDDKGAYKEGFDTILSYAKANNPEAQYVMGITFEKGQIVKQDIAKAREWYEKASMNRYPKATVAVGRFFEKGIGEEAHVGTAYEWYKFALEEQGWEAARPLYERMKRKLEDQERAESGEPNLRKVAIVGVDGSGKTVMLAGLGDLYAHPDANGFFLAPKDFGTSAYVNRQISLMRAGHWPKATVGDEMKGLNWLLRRKKDGGRPVDVCEVSFLDFAGEVYRAAFGINHVEDSHELSAQIEQLKSYVRDADDLIVLINLKDVIAHGLADRRTEEAMWISNSILEYALNDKDGGKIPRASIVLSQADSYAEIISDCGGAVGTLSKFLPHVANDYSWLDIFAASAVDKTLLNDDGVQVPSPDFSTSGLSTVMTWILRGVAPGVIEQGPNLFAEAAAEVESGKKPTDPFEIPIAEIERELYSSEYREMTPQEEAFLREAATGDPAAAQKKMERAAVELFEKGEKYERRSRCRFFNRQKNLALAVECWMKSAELKCRAAQKRLGDFYSDYENENHDYEEAHKWYLAAARQGEPEAQFEVGKRLSRYLLAPPTDESRLQAFKWFRLSAAQGHLGSLCQLGMYRENGYCGVRVDVQEAYSYYQKAVDGGYKYGATYLIKLHKKHEDYLIDYAQVAPLLKLATVNDIDSMILYGELLENGLGVQKDLRLALQYYQCAAGDNSDAEVAVARVRKKLQENA